MSSRNLRLSKEHRAACTDSTSTRVQERRISKKRRLSCDLKFILDYGLLRTSTTNRVPSLVRNDVSSRRFPLPREFLRVQLCVFPDVSSPSASCGAYYRRESLDARQMIRNNTRYYSRPTRRPTFAM